MPPPLLRTHMIKSILQHVLSMGHSQRRCAQALGISKGVVAKYVTAAAAAGLDWPAIAPLSEHELDALLVPTRSTAATVVPDFTALHRELRSAEQTSELQSLMLLSYAVCNQKKKNN